MTTPFGVFRGRENLPAVLPGFSHINRYWDPQQECFAAKILPGQYYVTLHEEVVVTVLGSCVSACIRDRVCGVGGMNHFLLPDEGSASGHQGNVKSADDVARYGIHAMELLINEILKNGGRRQNLEVKIAGGGRMLANMSDIGEKNVEFVRQFLVTEGIELVASDVGDIFPRKVYYFPGTGKVRVKKLRTMNNDTITNRERRYMDELGKIARHGDVELF